MNDNLDLIILKNIISNKKYALDFVSEHDSKLFSADVWNFANLIIGYLKTYKELPTLRVITEKLSKGNNDKLIENTKKIWEQLDHIKYDDKEYYYDLEKLKQRFAEKQIHTMKENLFKYDLETMNISKIVGEMQKVIQNISTLSQKKSYEERSIKDYLPQFVENFNSKKENPDFDAGIKTKYSFFDYATNGVKPADFILIAGESGFGKSLLLNNIAVQMWMQDNSVKNTNFTFGKDIIYFSLEMPYEDCFNRILSRLSGVPSRRIEKCKLTKEEFSKVKDVLDFIKNYPYQFKIVDIADACANDLEAILVDSDKEFDSIFIDYLGIMKPNKDNDEQDWLKQGKISYEIRSIARRYKKPIFSAVQLNRKNPSKESSENIGLNRLARSGTIATHATHVIQIENRPNEEQYDNFIYHFIKNRKGPKGKGTLLKNLSCVSLIDKNTSGEEYNDYFPDHDDISEELEKLEI